MGKWQKADPATAARFTAALPKHPELEPKKMFGYDACFVKGNFFAGMHEGHTVVVRLPAPLRDHFPVLAQAPIFDPMGNGRGMTDWFVVPADVVASTAKLSTLLAGAFVEVLKLPAKATKKAKKAKAKPTKQTKAHKKAAPKKAKSTTAKATKKR